MASDIDPLVFTATTKDLDQARTKLDAVTSSGKNAEKTASNLGKAFKAQKGSLQQSALQLQDVVVQLEGGVAASRAFAQQIPQLLGFFGPGGAFLGVAASLAAIGAASWLDPFVKKMITATSTTEKLDSVLHNLELRYKLNSDGVLELTQRIKDLSHVSEEAAKAELLISQALSRAAIEGASEKIKKEIEDISGSLISFYENKDMAWQLDSALEGIVKELGITIDQASRFANISQKAIKDPTVENINEFYNFAQSIDFTNRKMRDFYTIVGTNLSTINSSQRALEQLKTAHEDVTGAVYREEIEEIDELESRLEDHFRKKGELRDRDYEKQMERWRKSLELQSQEDAKNAQSLQNFEQQFLDREQLIQKRYDVNLQKIADFESKGLLTQERSQELQLQSKKQFNQSMAAMDSARLASLGGFLGQTAAVLEDGLGKQNAITKLAFIAQKALAIPQMITATEQGAAMALGLGPIAGPPLSALIRGLGYSAIGTVIGTTLAGRAQGGYVTAGQTYKVGEYGRDEYFTPSTSGRIMTQQQAANDGGGPKIEVLTNVKIIGGPGGETVTNNVRQISDEKFVQDIVINMMNNKASGAMQGIFRNTTAQPKGTR